MSVEVPKSSSQLSIHPEGVSSTTWSFLLDVTKEKAFTSLTAEQRNLIGIYYGSQASLRDLQTMFGFTSFSSVKYRILKGMGKLWASLSLETKGKYNFHDAVTMKQGMSESTRKKMSAVRQGRWDNDSEYRDTIINHNKARAEQYRVEHPLQLKEPNPPHVKRTKKSIIPIGSPEDRARKRANAEALWADPVIGARMREAAQHRVPSDTISDALKAVWKDPEYRERMSTIRKKTWEDPTHRKNLTEGIKRARNTPEVREKSRVALKARWLNPESRAEILKSRGRLSQAETEDYETNDSFIELWEFASEEGLLPQMVAQGMIAPQEIELVSMFCDSKGELGSVDYQLMEKFSIAVANLA